MQLNRCPHCGGNAKYRVNEKSKTVYIECSKCWIQTSEWDASKSLKEAKNECAKTWNARVSPIIG